jgi:hypothetical protein
MSDDLRAREPGPEDGVPQTGDGIRGDLAGSGEGSVSSGDIVSPAPSGGGGDRGQDGTESETGPGPQTDWLREAPGDPNHPESVSEPGA